MAKLESFDSLLWRTADRIHDSLKPERRSLRDLIRPEASWLGWQDCVRRIRKARDRGWTGAMNGARQYANLALTELTNLLEAALRMLIAHDDGPFVGGVAEIYRDLVSLRDEFADVSVDCRQRTVSAVTEPIELEETYLGPFEIRLSWTDARDSLNYEVLARDPHPAGASDEITHPHVQGNRLCEGEARMSIRLALQQGRLADFFVIVRQILETYNSGSAYVQLDEWFGQSCPDCGDRYADFERVSCEACETELCGDCARCCEHCESSYCGDCMWICPACSDSACNACLKRCSTCNIPRCEDCLNDERCSDCVKKEESDPLPAPPEAPDAAVQPLCVGEAAVSA